MSSVRDQQDGSKKRRWRNFLIEPKFQLKFAAYLIAVTLVLAGMLGVFLFRNTQALLDEASNSLEARSRAAEASRELSNATLSGGTLTIGGTALTAAQIDEIFGRNASNYLNQVSQQLIAARLNQLSGASTPAAVQTAINAAQALVQASGGPVSGTAQHHVLGGRPVLLLPLFHPAAGLRTPRVAESRIQFECRLHSIVPFGGPHLIVGQVLVNRKGERLLGGDDIALADVPALRVQHDAGQRPHHDGRAEVQRVMERRASEHERRACGKHDRGSHQCLP